MEKGDKVTPCNQTDARYGQIGTIYTITKNATRNVVEVDFPNEEFDIFWIDEVSKVD